jgi:CHAD domain-containing protein
MLAGPYQPYLDQMAYRFKRGEPVIRGLKRVAREEMEEAGAQLSGHKKPSRDEAIHDARKSIKKVRALLRLASPEQDGIYGRENARLRDIARRLSKFRDAFAIIETFDELKNKFKRETRNRLQSVRLGLTKRRSQSAREEDVGIVIVEAASALRKAAKRVKTWPLRVDGFAAIGPGLEETFRAGRKTLTLVRKDARPENLHELRKRVKDHWYHLRLLEDLWTDMIKAAEKSLKDLETQLGNDHNLVVLSETILADPAFYGEKKDIDLTLHLIEKYQKELREQSLVLAARIYDEKPRAFTRRMAGLWDTWRHS